MVSFCSSFTIFTYPRPFQVDFSEIFSFQHEADPVVVESPLKFIVLIIGGSTVLVFLCTIVFVCWWNVYRKPFIKETKIFNPGKK